MTRLRLIAVFAVALAVSIAATACGGNGDENDGASAGPAAAGGATTMQMDGKTSGTTERAAQASGDSPAADLRVTLDRLLGEHAVLAMAATQKGYSGDADFDEIAKALDANSVELSEAIASVYGEEAGERFLNGKAMWRDHIEFFVAYTVGLAKNDEAAQRKAVNDLGGYIQAFPAFLAEATGLPEDALRASITKHVNQLKGQIDAYAAGQYRKAYPIAREAYAHMFMTGDTLAGAIVAQSPEEFASS